MFGCPSEITHLLEEKFNFPANPLFGVVATRKNDGVNSRMMRIYDLDEKGRPILLTHIGAKKWTEMSSHPEISICMVSDDKLTQVIVRGSVTLETAPEVAAFYWERIREDVKMIYDPTYASDQPFREHPPLSALQDVPPTSGVAIVRPNFWETLELVLPYTDSYRYHYHPSDSGWSKERMSLG